MATTFPTRARRDDPSGHMVVQYLLEFLRDAFDKFTGTIIRGSAMVAQGATTVTVGHTLGSPQYSVVASPTSSPGGYWWISNKTSTQFVLNLQVAAPVGGVSFDWIVKG